MSKMTPGQALRILDVTKEDFPNAPDWENLNDAARNRYEQRAAGTLSLADKIRQQIGPVEPDRSQIKERLAYHGGSFHGPIVETLSMAEVDFWKFMKEVINGKYYK